MSAENQAPQKKRGLLIALVAGAFALGALGAAALLVNIAERKQEAKNSYVKLVEVTENDVDPAKWGTNWPREYDGYKRTSEPTHTKYGGGRVDVVLRHLDELHVGVFGLLLPLGDVDEQGGGAEGPEGEGARDEGDEQPALLLGGLVFCGHEVLLP